MRQLMRLPTVAVVAATCLLACGPSEPSHSLPRNHHSVPEARELAKNCFEIERAAIDKALADWVGLTQEATFRWTEGGQVPNLHKENWPAVALSDIRRGSLFARMGLRDGDLVYAFNGYSLQGFGLFVNILSDPSLAREMDAEASPAAAIEVLFQSSDYLSLAILRSGDAISINIVVAGAALTTCNKRPRLREKEAEEATWTEADWKIAEDRANEERQAQEAAAAELQATADGVAKVNDTTFEISSAISAKQMRSALTNRGARLVPRNRHGQPVGVAVYAVRPSSLYKALGLENGDTLHNISGTEVRTSNDVIDHLGQLPGKKFASIVLTRRGKSVTLNYSIK